MRSFMGRDILSLEDFEREEYFYIFDIAKSLEHHARKRRNGGLLSDKTMVTAFYEPSTRTRIAHEAAMHRLGGHVTGFSDVRTTRAGDFYQESIKDTARMLECYGDVIVMRHFHRGAPAEAAKWASIPVVNAGDGWEGEHPTQALSDLYTIWKEFDTIDGLTILCVGNVRVRSIHSLSYALSQFDVHVIYVSPPEMTLNPEFKTKLDNRNMSYEEVTHIADAIHKADIIYIVDIMREADYAKASKNSCFDRDKIPDNYKVTRDLLLKKAKRRAIVLSPLPRMDELPIDIDNTRHACYWQEAFNGVVVRMGMLALILGAIE